MAIFIGAFFRVPVGLEVPLAQAYPNAEQNPEAGCLSYKPRLLLGS